MPSLGKMEEFDLRSHNIERYIERLEQYFVANSIPATRQGQAQKKCHSYFSDRSQGTQHACQTFALQLTVVD